MNSKNMKKIINLNKSKKKVKFKKDYKILNLKKYKIKMLKTQQELLKLQKKV
jgi:hypothetical protein